jgi:hypothetical protein
MTTSIPKPIFLRAMLLACFVLGLSGCYSGSKLIKIPRLSDSIIVDNSGHEKLSCFVSGINAKFNSSGANTSEGFDKRFLSQLQKSNHFSDVIYGVYSKRPEGNYVDVRLEYNENIDLNQGSNTTKAFFTGLTFFLLAPVLPITFDYDVDFILSAKWPNGIRKEYKESCSAKAYGTFPYASTQKELMQVVGKASEKCLNSVINQLTSDRLQ